MSGDPMSPARRPALAAIPHRAASPVTIQHDLDDLARWPGIPVVTTACGRQATTTLTTRQPDRVRCQACKQHTCAQCDGPERLHEYSPPDWGSSDGLPTLVGCWCKGRTADSTDDFPKPVCGCRDYDAPDDTTTCCDHWHCDPQRAAHSCTTYGRRGAPPDQRGQPIDRTLPCPTCRAEP